MFAHDGGAGARPIGYGRQFVDREDVAAVVEVLESDFLTQGPQLPRFEGLLADATGAKHVVAVANGTAALHLAYAALGVGPGDLVVTTANTFLGTASAALHCGAEVEFLDIDPVTANLSLDALEARLEAGPPPAVVCVVHFAGLPVQMERVIALKRRFGFFLVEDAAHALGARYRVDGEMYGVGAHPEVDACCLSFHPVKHVTTGEGGAVLATSDQLAARVRRLAAHGIDPSSSDPPPGWEGAKPPWHKPMVELGFNYRLSELHAALGASQLTKLPAFLARRREIASIYHERLEGFRLPHPGDLDREHAWHLFVVGVEGDRDQLLAELVQRKIFCQLHYFPVPLQPYFRARYGPKRDDGGDYPHALAHAKHAISLPIHTGLAEGELDRVIYALNAWAHR